MPPTAKDSLPIDEVVINGLTLLKLVKHCKESLPKLVTGLLLGLDIDSTLEITNCFTLPTRGASDEELPEEVFEEYQLEMMRCLREVNVDSNTVAWYQSCNLGSYVNEYLIQTMVDYQESLPRSVVILYDPIRSSHGNLWLKALRLKPAFMDIHRSEEGFQQEQMLSKNMYSAEIFESIPVRIRNPHLIDAYLMQLSTDTGFRSLSDPGRFDFSSSIFLEKTLGFLNENIDSLNSESNKFQYYQRTIARQVVTQQSLLAKRRQENAQRRLAGEEPLSDADLLSNPAFRPIVPPSRLDFLLASSQIDIYCHQINQLAAVNFTNLYTSRAFTEENGKH